MGLWCFFFGHKPVREETVQELECGRFVNWVEKCRRCSTWMGCGIVFPRHFFDDKAMYIAGPNGTNGPRIW